MFGSRSKFNLKKTISLILVAVLFFNLFYFTDTKKIHAEEWVPINMAQAQTSMSARNLTKTSSQKQGSNVLIKFKWQKPRSDKFSAGDIWCGGASEIGKGAKFKFDQYIIFIFNSKTNQTIQASSIKSYNTTNSSISLAIPDSGTNDYLVNVRSDFKYDNWLTCGSNAVWQYCRPDLQKPNNCEGLEITKNNSNPKVSSTPKLKLTVDSNGNVNTGTTYSKYSPILKGTATWDKSQEAYKINLSWDKNPQAPGEPDESPGYKLSRIEGNTTQWSGLAKGNTVKNHIDTISKEFIQNRGTNNSLVVTYGVYAYYKGIPKQDSVSNSLSFTLTLKDDGEPENPIINGDEGTPPSADDIHNATDIGPTGPTAGSDQCHTQCQSNPNTKDIPYSYVCEALCWVSTAFMNLFKMAFELFQSAITTETENPEKPNIAPYLEE